MSPVGRKIGVGHAGKARKRDPIQCLFLQMVEIDVIPVVLSARKGKPLSIRGNGQSARDLEKSSQGDGFHLAEDTPHKPPFFLRLTIQEVHLRGKPASGRKIS